MAWHERQADNTSERESKPMRTPTEIVHLDDDDNRDQNEIEGELEKKKNTYIEKIEAKRKKKMRMWQK